MGLVVFIYICKIRDTILDFSMMQLYTAPSRAHKSTFLRLYNFRWHLLILHQGLKQSPFPVYDQEFSFSQNKKRGKNLCDINMQFSYHKIGVMALLFFVAIATSGLTVDAQSICNVPLESLATCKPAVTQPHPTAPSKECCTAISHADMKCLCSYKNSTMLPSLGIDPDLAVHLPAKCQIRNAHKC